MKITPTSLTVSQLFSSENEQFFIPAYQRRYSWQDKHTSDLFKDIDKLADNDNHLLGSVVCLTDSHTAGINTLELIDGQQRITTLTLLFKAIKDKYNDLKETANVNKIDSFLFCKDIDGKRKNKLLLGDLDSSDYLEIIDPKVSSKIENVKLLNAYKNFLDWINKLSVNELNKFYYKLINNVYIIRLDVGQSKDAYKLFETINDRGLSLSPTDIIKNFLLGHASLIDSNTLDRIKAYWKKLIINCDGLNSDDFFRQYLCCILKRKIAKSKLIEEFKKYYLGTVVEANILSDYTSFNNLNLEADYEDANVEDEDVRQEIPENHARSLDVEVEINTRITDNKKCSISEFASKLTTASGIYRQLRKRSFSNEKFNLHLYNLQRIQSFPAYILLLDVVHRKIETGVVIEIFKIIETFMLRRHICEYRTAELDTIFSKLTGCNDANIINIIKNELKKQLPSDQDFKSKFVTHNYKNKFERAKYVLEMIEYKTIKSKGEYTLNQGDDLHLEHIIPQKIVVKKSKQEYEDWVTYLGTDAEIKHLENVNKIGNLTLLAKQLNLKASNNTFDTKKKEYAKSNISITKSIAENFEKFKIGDLNKRSKKLASIACDIWKI